MTTSALREGLIQTQIGSDLLIYDVKNEKFFAFNEAATRIVHALEYCLPENKFLELVYGFFSNTAGTEIRIDIDSSVKIFLQKMKRADLLQDVEPSNKENFISHQSNIPFKTPHFNEYTKDWLKSNHPAAFYTVGFGDTWGPGSDHPHP